MKTGKSLIELAAELTRQQESKRDFVASTRSLAFHEPLGAKQPFTLEVDNEGSFDINELTHNQIASRVGIPQKYYDRMREEAPVLLTDNVQHWFNKKPERRMVRTLDGNARAFLSDRYRPLDNYDLAETVLPILTDSNNVEIVSCEITQNRMYIKALFPKIEGEIAKGDAVQSGIVISNSEVGLGALKIEPLIYRLVCLNGLIAADHATRKYHVGRAADGGEAAMELYRDETLKQDDRAFWMKVQDTMRGAFDQAKFQMILERMQETTGRVIAGDPVKAVEVVQKQFGLSDTDRGGVLKHLIQGGDLSQYGLLNAVTRYSQDVADYDKATEFERMGGQIIELSKNAWQQIAQAA